MSRVPAVRMSTPFSSKFLPYFILPTEDTTLVPSLTTKITDQTFANPFPNDVRSKLSMIQYGLFFLSKKINGL